MTDTLRHALMHLPRKERERRERQLRILEVARPMLLEGGYHTLNMDRIAERLEVSKGTIYNSYRNKEEIIIALVIQTLNIRKDMFNRASAFRGMTRERLYGIGMACEIFFLLYPEHFAVEQLIRSDSLWEKTSEERRSAMQMCEQSCTGIVAGIVRDGLSQGDLALPKGIACEDVVFGLWSMYFGAFSIMATSASLPEVGIADPLQALRQSANMILDGYHWKPLSQNHDYMAVRKRIQQEVFADEYRQIAQG